MCIRDSITTAAPRAAVSGNFSICLSSGASAIKAVSYTHLDVYKRQEPSRRRGVIQIRIFRDGGDLVLDVRDNGIGMDQTELENLMSHPGHTDQISGIGIRNIHQRIFMEFGAPYGLEIESVKNEFTCIHIRMPLLAEQPEAAAAVQTVKQ